MKRVPVGLLSSRDAVVLAPLSRRARVSFVGCWYPDHLSVSRMTTKTMDLRLEGLLQREFVTIKLTKEPGFFQSLANVRAECARRNILDSTEFAFAVDRECGKLYATLAASYLDRLLQRVGELGEPWTVELRGDSLALLNRQLGTDWNWTIGVR